MKRWNGFVEGKHPNRGGAVQTTPVLAAPVLSCVLAVDGWEQDSTHTCGEEPTSAEWDRPLPWAPGRGSLGPQECPTRQDSVCVPGGSGQQTVWDVIQEGGSGSHSVWSVYRGAETHSQSCRGHTISPRQNPGHTRLWRLSQGGAIPHTRHNMLQLEGHGCRVSRWTTDAPHSAVLLNTPLGWY